jgi:micrococcal nuclease
MAASDLPCTLPRVRALAVVVVLAGVVGAVAGCEASSPAAPGTASVPVPAGAQEAVVVRHADGDTLTLRGRGTGPLPGQPTRVRLLLVDTPELRPTPECGAEEATDALRDLAPVGSTVRVTADRQRLDRFGRTLLYVWNDDGELVQQRLLEAGHARVLVVRPNTRLEAELRRAEAVGAGRRSCAGN